MGVGALSVNERNRPIDANATDPCTLHETPGSHHQAPIRKMVIIVLAPTRPYPQPCGGEGIGRHVAGARSDENG